MKLLDNWKAILTGAWSVKFGAVSALLIGASEMLILIPDDSAQSLAAFLKYCGYAAGALGAFVARFLDQGIPETTSA